MLTSIIIPLFNECESLRALLDEIGAVVASRQLATEVIFVDDGSTDNSWNCVVELVRRYEETGIAAGAATQASARDGSANIGATNSDPACMVRGIRLRRNCGKSAAVGVGLAATRGKYVVTLDADLQDDPHEIPQLLEALDRDADLVVGWKKRRQDRWTRIRFSRLFNVTVSAVSGLWLHDHNCGLKAFRRDIIPALWMERGMHRFMTVMAKAAGFRVREIEVRHRKRRFGKSKYGWARVPESAWDLTRLMWRTRWGRRSAAAGRTGSDLAGECGLAREIIERAGFDDDPVANGPNVSRSRTAADTHHQPGGPPQQSHERVSEPRP